MTWVRFWQWLLGLKQPPAWREVPVSPEIADPEARECESREACQPLGEDD